MYCIYLHLSHIVSFCLFIRWKVQQTLAISTIMQRTWMYHQMTCQAGTRTFNALWKLDIAIKAGLHIRRKHKHKRKSVHTYDKHKHKVTYAGAVLLNFDHIALWESNMADAEGFRWQVFLCLRSRNPGLHGRRNDARINASTRKRKYILFSCVCACVAPVYTYVSYANACVVCVNQPFNTKCNTQGDSISIISL